MMMCLRRCSYEDIDRINEIFDSLDRDAGGTLNKADVLTTVDEDD